MDSGSKLRTASEFGKLHQVRRLLADGAAITKDSVSDGVAQGKPHHTLCLVGPVCYSALPVCSVDI